MKSFWNDPAFLILVTTIDRSQVGGGGLKIRESFPDIGTISKSDDLWAQAFGYCVAYLVRMLSSFWKSWPITVFYHDRTIKEAHREMVESSLQSALPRLSAEELKEVKITDIVGVPDPLPGQPYSLEDDGIWLAHATTQLVKRRPREEFSGNFLFTDTTNIAVKVENAKMEAQRQEKSV